MALSRNDLAIDDLTNSLTIQTSEMLTLPISL